MSGEATTIARPYAAAIFDLAVEKNSLDLWSEMLDLLAAVVSDENMTNMIDSPKMGKDQLTELVIEIGGGRLNDEGQNLIRLLVENDRLVVLPEINSLFIEAKNKQEGTLEVMVASAFAIKPAQEELLAKALKKKLGREIKITTEEDSSLLGGVKITAGDMVIDGSVQGQLNKLANELGI